MNIVLSCESEVRVVPASAIKCAWITRASERRVKLVVDYDDEHRVLSFTTSPMVQAKAQDLLERITTALVSIHHAPLQKEQADEPSVILSDAPPSGSATPTPVDAAGGLPSAEERVVFTPSDHHEGDGSVDSRIGVDWTKPANERLRLEIERRGYKPGDVMPAKEWHAAWDAAQADKP